MSVPDDWRTPEKRQIVVAKIAEAVQLYPDVLNRNPSEIEEAIYGKVNDKDQYMNMVGKVLLSIKHKGHQLMANRGMTNPGHVGGGGPGGMMGFQPGMHPDPSYMHAGMHMRGPHPGMPPMGHGPGMGGHHPMMSNPHHMMGGRMNMMPHGGQMMPAMGGPPHHPMMSMGGRMPHNMMYTGGGGRMPMGGGMVHRMPGMNSQPPSDGMQSVTALPNPSFSSGGPNNMMDPQMHSNPSINPNYNVASQQQQQQQQQQPMNPPAMNHQQPTAPPTNTQVPSPASKPILQAPSPRSLPMPSPSTPWNPNSPARAQSPSQMQAHPEANAAVLNKLQELQPYVPLLARMMDKIEKGHQGDKTKNEQWVKLNSLYNVIQSKNIKVPLQTLEKCHTALDRLSKKDSNHMESFERAVKENGSLTYCTVQCMPFGPPRVGKTCLLKRLLDETPPGKPSTKSEASRDSKSTDVLEERKMIQVVRMKHAPPNMIISESGEWKQVDSLEDQTAIIIKSVHSQCKPDNNLTDDNSRISIEDTQPDKPNVSSVIPVSVAPSSSVSVASNASGTDLDNITINTIAQALKFKNIDMSKFQTLLSNSLTIFYTDTGGQPEFQEVLPAVVAGPTIFLLIFSLFNGLDSLYEVKYEPSPLDGYQAYESSFTVRQVLMQCLASIASYHNAQSRDFLKSTNTANLKLQPPPVKIFTIATHKDLVDSKMIEEIDADLKESVADTVFEDSNLIEPFSDKSMIIPVNNYASEDGNVVRNVIERVIRREESDFQITIPVPWLGVEIALRQRDSSTISYSECLDVAKKFNIPQHELPDCLWFLHYKTGSIRYYGERVTMLENVVIIKPAIIFATITEFITSTFVLKKVRPNIWQNFRTRGLFKTSEVRRIFGKHKKELELLSFDQLLALLQHLNILSKAYDFDFDYFLPCALVHVDPSKDDSLTANTVLLVLFKGGVVPKGVFSGSLAVLVEKKWIIKRDHNRQPLLFRNQATFFVNSLKCSVTFTSKLNFISVGVNFEDEPSSQASSRIRKVLEASLSNVCKILQYAADIWHFGVYCTHTACKAEGQMNHHSAKVLDGLEEAKCTTTFMNYTLEQKDRAWFIQSDNSGIPLISEGVMTQQRKRMHETQISSGMGLEESTPAAAGGLTPNKSLSDCIRKHTKELCHVLSISERSLILFTLSLFGKGLIDDAARQSIVKEKDIEGAILLLDLVRSYLDGNEDDTKRCDTVMKCFEEVGCLKDVLTKMKRDLDVQDDTKKPRLE